MSPQLTFSLFTDFENGQTFKPAEMHEGTVKGNVKSTCFMGNCT